MPTWILFVLFLAASFSARAQGTDRLLSDELNDPNAGFGQSESGVAASQAICVAWNDRGALAGTTLQGWASQSTANPPTWTDRGQVGLGDPNRPNFDPSLTFRQSDNRFYFAAGRSETGRSVVLYESGISGECESFTYRGSVVSLSPGIQADRPHLLADNTSSPPYYGRLYLAFVTTLPPFGIYVSYTDNPVTEPASGWTQRAFIPGLLQAPWLAIAPDGKLFLAALDMSPPGDPVDYKLFVSTDRGAQWAATAAPIAASIALPSDPNESSLDVCRVKALAGGIRTHAAGAQIAIHPDSGPTGYAISAVYARLASATDDGDVFYRRSTNGGANWDAERRLNDDGGSNDQWSPSLAAAGKLVVASWYDRRLDPANLLFDRFALASGDGGVTWSPNLRISDVSSRVTRTRPHVDGQSDCYHGDYDQLAITGSTARIVWSDDRRLQPPCPINSGDPNDPFAESCPDPDIWYDEAALPDTDSDGTLDRWDNCPTTANPTQGDFDMDNVGDACDSCETIVDTVSDTDMDGVDQACDTCLNQANPIIDANMDGIPDAPTTNRTMLSHQRDDDADGRGSRCDFDYNNAGLALTASDFNDMTFSFTPSVGLMTQSTCGATVGNPPEGEGGSGAAQRCGEFDHDGVGAVVGAADFNLCHDAVQAGGVININFPKCSACTQGTGWSGVLGPGARLGRPVCQSPVAGACIYAP